MKKLCDLHCHSNYSDGTNTPAELVRIAEDQGLSALALTDHNTSAGLKEFMEAGKNSSVITVPGCEFTTEWNGKELHIVGLFFAEETWPEIEDFLEMTHIAKINSNMRMIENLRAAGYDVTYDEAAALTETGEFNRAHVGTLLMQKGYVGSVTEAFEKLLSEEKGLYVPPRRITSLAAIRFIKTYKATAVFAHPLMNLTPREMEMFLPQAKEAGLDAMETRYSEFDEEMTKTAVSLAEKYGLKQSGGSDYHGERKPWLTLGKGRGNLEIPYSVFEEMLSCADYKI